MHSNRDVQWRNINFSNQNIWRSIFKSEKLKLIILWKDCLARRHPRIYSSQRSFFFFIYIPRGNICVWSIQGYIHRHARRQLTERSKSHAFVSPSFLFEASKGLPMQTYHYFDYSSAAANHCCRSCHDLTTNHYFSYFALLPFLVGLRSP